jgi:hypothetical protein
VPGVRRGRRGGRGAVTVAGGSGKERRRPGDGPAAEVQRESRAVAAEAWRWGSVMGMAVSKEVGRRRD